MYIVEVLQKLKGKKTQIKIQIQTQIQLQLPVLQLPPSVYLQFTVSRGSLQQLSSCPAAACSSAQQAAQASNSKSTHSNHPLSHQQIISLLTVIVSKFLRSCAGHCGEKPPSSGSQVRAHTRVASGVDWMEGGSTNGAWRLKQPAAAAAAAGCRHGRRFLNLSNSRACVAQPPRNQTQTTC